MYYAVWVTLGLNYFIDINSGVLLKIVNKLYKKISCSYKYVLNVQVYNDDNEL